MKKFVIFGISCSLALALNASAQQDDQQQQQQQEKKKEHKKARAEERQDQNAPGDQTQRPAGSPGEYPAKQHPHAGRRAQNEAAPNANPEAPTQPQPKAEEQPKPEAEATAQPAYPPKGRHAQQKGQQAQPPNAAAPVKAAPQAQAAAGAAPAAQKNPQRKAAAEAKKPDVAAIKTKNSNFHAQPKPEVAPPVTFVQNRTIVEAQNWQGPQYNAFREYRPAIHDRGWYQAHYPRVVLIGGGYYYFNGGYWYPAWGYATAQQYYAYDGPIYAGRQAEPPDKVIANVQSSLQQMGYYTGEVDGLLGPLTQEALNGYQADYDLTVTGAIDEPTLEALGMT